MDAAFAAAQSRWDHMAPPEHDDPTDSELSEARDAFLADAWATSDWLCQNTTQLDGGTTSTHKYLWVEDLSNATVDELWVLILTGNDKRCLAARHELVERMCDSSAADIEDRVPAIRASNVAEAREYAAELQAEAA